MDRTIWNLPQHYTAVINIIATVLVPSMRMLFVCTTYLCLLSFKVTVLAPSRLMFFCYRYIFKLVFFHVLVCSLFVPCLLKF